MLDAFSAGAVPRARGRVDPRLASETVRKPISLWEWTDASGRLLQNSGTDPGDSSLALSCEAPPLLRECANAENSSLRSRERILISSSGESEAPLDVGALVLLSSEAEVCRAS